MKMGNLSFFILLLCGYTVVVVSGGSTVESLPGYGDLPFKLETGYIGVGENEEVQLFYYFVESENAEAPLLVWIPGGPGCSSLGPFFFAVGPLALDTENYTGGLPTLLLNEYSWTKALNIIFLDGPVGVGFSYSNTTNGYNSSDTKYAENIYEFIQKWLNDHQIFLNHPLYFSGEGYAGNLIPQVIQKILDGNKGSGGGPIINVKGYAMGNPGTDKSIDFNARVPLANRLTLISDEIFEDASTKCNDIFFPPPSDEDSNKACALALQTITKLLCAINPNNVLDPSCSDISQCLQTHHLESDCPHSFISLPSASHKRCPKYNNGILEIWARNADVQKALHIRPETVTAWPYCNQTVDKVYDKNVPSVVGFHRNFTKTSIRGLIYSGDHDTSIPYIGTKKWIKSLELPLTDPWRAWFVDDEVAGYTETFKNGDFSLTCATVKGAGHFAAEFRAECYEMISKWLASEPL